jgi:hypothetical protein
MEWVELLLSFTEKQTGHFVTLLAAYAWPIVVIVLFVQQRMQIGKLIDRVKTFKAGKDGVSFDASEKLESAKDNLAKAETEVIELVPEVKSESFAVSEDRAQEDVNLERVAHDELQEQQRQRLYNVFNGPPQMVVFNAWLRVRAALYELLGLKRDENDWYGIPDVELLAMANEQKKITPSLFTALYELFQLRQQSQATLGWNPNQAQLYDYVQRADEAVFVIRKISALKK